MEELAQAIREQRILMCKHCPNAPVKPNIVFFGESLPQEFLSTCADIQMEQPIDLVIVMGTALAVSPFNMLPSMVKEGVPKVLFNMENTDKTGGIDFTEPGRKKLFVQGKCDEAIFKLAKDCGWEADFNAVLPDFHRPAAS